MLMSSLDTSIANAALPVLSAAFGAPFQAVRWVILAYLVALTGFTVIAGRLGDILGRRRLLLAGVATFTAASLACGLAPSLAVLLVARAAQGLGAATMMALAMALAGDIVTVSRTGRAMGALGTVSAIGTTLGPSLGGAMTARFGWEAIFLVNVPVGMAALLLVHRGVPRDESRPRSSERMGAAGSRVFRSPSVVSGLLASLLVAAVMMTTLVVGPFYLSRALGLGAAAAGLALSVGPLVAVLAGMPAGRLVDRFGASTMTLAGLTGLGIGALAVSLVPTSAGLAGYLASIVVMTASYALFQAANNTFLMTIAGGRDRGVVAGLLGLARNLGLITGASVMTSVFAWGVGSSDAASADAGPVAAGVFVAFAMSAALAVVAIAAIAIGRGLSQQRPAATIVRPLPHATVNTSQGE
jgi:MFS family permease